MTAHKTVPVEPTAEMIAAIEGHLLTTSRGAILNIKSGLKAAIEAAPPSPVTELETMLAEVVDGILTADSMCSDACLIQSDDLQSRANKLHHDSMEKARTALAAFNAKKGAV